MDRRLRRPDADVRLHGWVHQRCLAMSAEPRAAAPEPNHLRRFATIWLLASVIATPLAVLLLGPEPPPGKGSAQSGGQVTDNTVLLGMATPVLLLVVTYL